MSLLQLIKRFKLHVVKTSKQTLFTLGNIDQTTRICVNVRIKHVFSKNFTQFHQIVLQQMFVHFNRPNGTRYANTENTTLDRGFMAKQCLYS